MSAKVREILRKLAEAKSGEGKPRTGYQHPYAVYVKRYQKDLSTIKRWAKEGRPLDDEAAMLDIMSPRGRKAEFPTDAQADFDEAEGEVSPVALDEAFFAGAGVLAAIDRLQKAERERAGAYFRAIKERKHSKVVQERFKEWMGLVSALQKLEEAAPGIRKANELTVDKSEMDAAIGQVFAAFRTAVRNLPGRAAAKLIGLRDRDEIYGILEKEMEVLLRSLTDIAVGALREAEQLEQDAKDAEQNAGPSISEEVEKPAETAPAPEKKAKGPKVSKKRKARRRK